MVLFQRDDKENILGSIPYRMIGVAGRFTYNYDSRYLAEVNIGYNGSEQFAPGHRFGLFPAFSLGWVISNEKFMQGLHDSGTITNLKLRASVGKVGNDELYAGADEATRRKTPLPISRQQLGSTLLLPRRRRGDDSRFAHQQRQWHRRNQGAAYR